MTAVSSRTGTLVFELKQDNEYNLAEYACDEGNYAKTDILSGARLEESKKT